MVYGDNHGDATCDIAACDSTGIVGTTLAKWENYDENTWPMFQTISLAIESCA